jgi:hypothetical protein
MVGLMRRVIFMSKRANVVSFGSVVGAVWLLSMCQSIFS